MPGTMLKKMLDTLYRSGVEFCHPRFGMDAASCTRMESTVMHSDAPGFAKDIPGDSHFHPNAAGHQPYYPPERHPGHVEIILPITGTVDFLINEHWKRLREDRVHILLRNTLHTERHYRYKNYTLLWLTVLPSSLTLHRTTYSRESGYGQSACRVVIAPPMARQLWECGGAETIDEAHYFSLLVQCLDFSVAHHLAEQHTEDYHYAVLSQIKEFLDENFFKSPGLDELAQMGHCSPVHLNRIFLKQYGTTIHQYVLERRLNAAKRLLSEGLPPGEAAHSSGFNDQRYFSRVFRQKTGCTPSEFQRGGK